MAEYHQPRLCAREPIRNTLHSNTGTILVAPHVHTSAPAHPLHYYSQTETINNGVHTDTEHKSARARDYAELKIGNDICGPSTHLDIL